MSNKKTKKDKKNNSSKVKQHEKLFTADELCIIEYKINDIIKRFNYKKVETTMKALNWKWMSAGAEHSEIPTIERMKATSRYLLRRCATSKERIWATGGFQAESYHDGGLRLLFYVDDVVTPEDDE